MVQCSADRCRRLFTDMCPRLFDYSTRCEASVSLWGTHPMVYILPHLLMVERGCICLQLCAQRMRERQVSYRCLPCALASVSAAHML